MCSNGYNPTPFADSLVRKYPTVYQHGSCEECGEWGVVREGAVQSWYVPIEVYMCGTCYRRNEEKDVNYGMHQGETEDQDSFEMIQLTNCDRVFRNLAQ